MKPNEMPRNRTTRTKPGPATHAVIRRNRHGGVEEVLVNGKPMELPVNARVTVKLQNSAKAAIIVGLQADTLDIINHKQKD